MFEIRYRLLAFVSLLLVASAPAAANEDSRVVIRLKPGDKAPGFHARDQFGREQTLESLSGAKGLILLFFRSADW